MNEGSTCFDGLIGAVRSTSLDQSSDQSSLAVKLGFDCGTSRVNRRPGSNWHKWDVTGARALPPGYANFVVLRVAATNPVARNLRDSSDTSVVEDSAGNLWTRASSEVSLFDGAPSQYREVWYAIVENALRPGDCITVKMPAGLSFDRAAAKASMHYRPFADGYVGADEYLSRFTGPMMWWKGLETLLAYGINAEAIGRRFTIRFSIAAEGSAAGDAEAIGDALFFTDGRTKRRRDDEAIVSGLWLLNTARRQRVSVREQRRVPPSRPAVPNLRLVK